MRDLIGLRARLLLPLPACEEVDENTEKHGFVFTIVSRFQMQAPSPGQANSEIARSLVAPITLEFRAGGSQHRANARSRHLGTTSSSGLRVTNHN